ncbi:MAG: DsbA family protein [Rhodothalassiaceae bacterium]
MSKRITSAEIALVLSVFALLLSGLALWRMDAAREDADFTEKVRAALLAAPEMLPEAIAVLQSRDEAARKAEQSSRVGAQWESLRNDPMAPTLGPADAPVTMIEFYDYQCGFCRRSFPDVMRILAEKKDGIRYIFRQYPVLDGDVGTAGLSHYAARAAIAADRQGAFLDFHKTLMTDSARLSKRRIHDVAESLGLDMERFRKDIDDPAIAGYLADSLALGRHLGIDGTPGYIVNRRILIGAHGYDALMSLIAAAESDPTD